MEKYTEIGLVLEVMTFCNLDKHGLDIQITSGSGDNTNVWMVKYTDQNATWMSYNTEIQNIPEAQNDLMQDTNQEQAIIQFETSDNHIPIGDRKWTTSLSMN